MAGIANPNNGANSFVGVGGYGHRNHIFCAQRDGNYRTALCGIKVRRDSPAWRKYVWLRLNDPDRPAVTCKNCILALTQKEPLE